MAAAWYLSLKLQQTDTGNLVSHIKNFFQYNFGEMLQGSYCIVQKIHPQYINNLVSKKNNPDGKLTLCGKMLDRMLDLRDSLKWQQMKEADIFSP